MTASMPLTVSPGLTVMIVAETLDPASRHHCVLTPALPQPAWNSTRYWPARRPARV